MAAGVFFSGAVCRLRIFIRHSDQVFFLRREPRQYFRDDNYQDGCYCQVLPVTIRSYQLPPVFCWTLQAILPDSPGPPGATPILAQLYYLRRVEEAVAVVVG